MVRVSKIDGSPRGWESYIVQVKMVSGFGGFDESGAFMALIWQVFHGSLARRVLVRGLLSVVAISTLLLMQFITDYGHYGVGTFIMISGECDLDPNSILGRVMKPFAPVVIPYVRRIDRCDENGNVTMSVVSELIGMNLLNHDARALCVGFGCASSVGALREAGFVNVLGSGLVNANGVLQHSVFQLKQEEVVHVLDCEDNSFDFVLMRDLDKVSVPALLVNELERILKPGGLGAVLIAGEGSSAGSLIRSATSVTSCLRSSDVVHVTSLMGFTLVAFQKKSGVVDFFEFHRLPSNCPSIARNKPLIGRMETLVEGKMARHAEQITYLPTLINITSDMRLVYVDMGAKETLNFSNNNWFLPSYPIDSRSFQINIVDHDVLVLSSHVNKPGVTFIYHPELAGKDDSPNPTRVQDIEIPIDDEDFDFLAWFKDTVEFADLVVLKMNLGKAELKFLFELFESGAICSVDELFLSCSDSDLENAGGGPKKGCLDLFKGLRHNGVFVHQWWVK
ncbi:hypothetical protein Drorol1_Dr00013897 [Drosera rotundifolia]